jgi:hypothetical protein
LKEFRAAYQGQKWPRALAQIAIAEQALGSWLDAEAHMKEALSKTEDAWISTRRPALERALADVQLHLASVDIRGGVPGADVRVNGRPAGRLPLNEPLRVVAGSSTVDVNAPGYFPVSRVVNVAAGGIARETIELFPTGAPAPVVTAPVAPLAPPASAPSPTPDAPPATSGTSTSPEEKPFPRRQVGVGLAAAGAATLVFGVAAQVVREVKMGNFNDGCSLDDNNHVVGGSGCQSQYDSANTWTTAAVVGYVAGGVMLAGGAALIWLSSSRGDRAPGAATAQLSCAPSGGLSFGCVGRF